MLGIFLDTETNGLNPFYHHVFEIAFKIVDFSTGEVRESYQSIIHQGKEIWEESDPVSLQVNGFTYEKLSKGQKKEIVAQEIIHLFQQNKIQRASSVFICQNPSFDRAFFSQLITPELQESLYWPYYWLDLASMYWVISIQKGRKDPSFFPWVTGFSKDQIATTYHLPNEPTPHKAMNGVEHLILCYKNVVGFT